MGWIKRYKVRREERRQLYRNILTNYAAVVSSVPEASGENIALSEEARGLYREFLSMLTQFKRTVDNVTWLDNFLHHKEIQAHIASVDHHERAMAQLLDRKHKSQINELKS